MIKGPALSVSAPGKLLTSHVALGESTKPHFAHLSRGAHRVVRRISWDKRLLTARSSAGQVTSTELLLAETMTTALAPLHVFLTNVPSLSSTPTLSVLLSPHSPVTTVLSSLSLPLSLPPPLPSVSVSVTCSHSHTHELHL